MAKHNDTNNSDKQSEEQNENQNNNSSDTPTDENSKDADLAKKEMVPVEAEPEAEQLSEAELVKKAKEKAKQEKKSRKRRDKITKQPTSIIGRIPWVAVFSLIICIGILYMVLQNAKQSEQLKTAQQLLDQSQQEYQRRMDGVQTTLGEYKNQIATLVNKLSDAENGQTTLEEKIKQVGKQVAEKGKDPLIWRIAEVEYLLSIANERLQLSQDVDTAIAALKDADKRLRSMADPGLSKIRQAIADEIKTLQSLEVPDIAGMSMRLEALVKGIEQLPLVNRERVEKPQKVKSSNEVESWKQIPAAMWKDIKELVSVRRNDQKIEPLLPPTEKHYLSQNLGLKLEQAKVALLRQDTKVFRGNLKDTGLWVARYFDQDASSVRHVVATINDMLGKELTPNTPDISGSLRQLRLWKTSQQKVAVKTPVSAISKKKVAKTKEKIVAKNKAIVKIGIEDASTKLTKPATNTETPTTQSAQTLIPIELLQPTKTTAAPAELDVLQ